MTMGEIASFSWQCDQRGLQKRIGYLFNTRLFSDITVKCKNGFSFHLHRMVLAMSSPVFEAMIFGSLARSVDTLCLDDTSDVLKYVFKDCYGVEFHCGNINDALKIFKIADKYILTELKEKCILIICDLIKPENFKVIYDFVNRYDFHDLRDRCILHLQQTSNVTKASAVLLWFSKNSPEHLLIPVFCVDNLTLDTWRHPKEMLLWDEDEYDVRNIVESNSCNNLYIFAGQVSSYVFEILPGPLVSRFHCYEPEYTPVLKFTLDNSNVKEIIWFLHERYEKYGTEDIGIHITDDSLPSIERELYDLPMHNFSREQNVPNGSVTFYFSDLTVENISSVNYIIFKLLPAFAKVHTYVNAYMFPRCMLSRKDCNELCAGIFHTEEMFKPYTCIRICPPGYIVIKDKEHLYHSKEQTRGPDIPVSLSCIDLISNEKEIPGW